MVDSCYYVENINVRESYNIVFRNLGKLTFSRKTSANVLKLDANRKVRNSNRKTLTLLQTPSNNMLQNKSSTGEITGDLSHKSPRRNMHKLSDCIKTPLKSFLACLTFHWKKCDFLICIRGRTLDPLLVNSCALSF